MTLLKGALRIILYRLRSGVPFSDPVQRSEDILANISRIEEHTAGIADENGF